MLRLTLGDTTSLLLGASMIGAIDVFWFHLWRFLLYRQPTSVAEEATHIAGYATFIAIAAALLHADSPHEGRGLVLAAFGLYLIVTAVDVLLERSSRATLGGLPPLEYLLHVLIVFGIGGAAATFWWASRATAGGPLEGMDRTRVVGSIVFTATLMILEGILYARALLDRYQHPLPRAAHA